MKNSETKENQYIPQRFLKKFVNSNDLQKYCMKLRILTYIGKNKLNLYFIFCFQNRK